MFHFDWTINVSGIVSAMALLGAVVNYGRKAVKAVYLQTLQHGVMWVQFEKEHPDLALAIEKLSAK